MLLRYDEMDATTLAQLLAFAAKHNVLASEPGLVNAIASRLGVKAPKSDAEKFDDELVSMCRRDSNGMISGKIDAIKEHRARTGAGLKDSKDYVEALMAKRGLA